MAVVHREAAAPSVDFVSAFADVAAEVVATAPSCDMGARVPACPSWSTYDLVTHLGNVHAWAATIVETGRSAAEQNDQPPSRRARAVARWYAAKAEDLLQVLRGARPEDPCWTLSEGHCTKAFWPRRQTHETLVHLVDLQQAAGRTTDIPPSLAADGVAEVLEVFLPRMHARGRRASLSAPLVLHATDTGHLWRVAAPLHTEDGPPVATRLTPSGPAGADAGSGTGSAPGGGPGSGSGDGADVVSAPAAELMLLLWKRLPPTAPAVTLDGDPDRILAFLASPLTP